MLDRSPTREDLKTLLGPDTFDLWHSICSLVERYYDMDTQWNSGGKAGTYEYKYRRGGKTLCALYAKEAGLGFLIIFGKAERARFEADRAHFTAKIQEMYDTARTYHDGKWLMIEPEDISVLEDIKRLLLIKRKPNRT